MRKAFLLFAITGVIIVSCSNPAKEDVTDFVDPFIGTAAHGHVFPGAATPFGMVQLSPDNGTSGWDWCSGYNYSDTLNAGFSHTHLSGTGIGDLCDILFMPSMNVFDMNLPDTVSSAAKQNRSHFSHANEQARPGYYSVVLDNGVDVELTATPRCGVQRYTSSSDGKMFVLVDLGFAINWDRPVECSLDWDGTHLSGKRISTGWAARQYQYFCSEFSLAPSAIKMYSAGRLQNGSSIAGSNIECVLEFDVRKNQELIIKTGLSAVDIDGAQNNLKSEMPGWDFTVEAAAARQSWQRRLEVIKASSSDKEAEKKFYTSLYHSMIAPSLYSDVDGRYRGTDLQVHTATGFRNFTVFSLWDTYRAEHPLFTLTAPDLVPDFVNTMLSIYDEQGKLPVWSLTGNETDCMIGYHSVPVIADAIHKGFRGFDYGKALEASLQSANMNFRGLDKYRQYGYIPSELENESVSKTLEYAIDDWCIYQMAGDLGKTDVADEFMKRSKNYRNVFDTSICFVRGRMQDGSWRTEFDPLYSNHTRSDFTEGNAWQYTWLVPQDVDGLISLFGSKKLFIQRLDSLFRVVENVKGENASPDISGLIGQYAHGNEPSHHISYLFTAAGEPEKTAVIVQKIMNQLYTTGKDGLCGNEDCGQMSAWYVFSAMGFYPLNPADGKFIFGSPALDKAVISLPGGKSFSIECEREKPGSILIDKVILNGKELDRNYITYNEIMSGGVLRFLMK